MRKRDIAGIIGTWVLFAIIVFILFWKREASPVKEIIAWVNNIYPVLAILAGVAVTLSSLIIKRSLGRPLINKPKDDKPYIEYKHKGEWQFYSNGQAIYRAAEIWFVNKPSVRTEKSVAKKVTCLLTFFDRTNGSVLPVNGSFTQPESQALATVRNLIEEIDEWHPNNKPQKLMIAFKWPGDEIAYAFAKDNFYDTDDGRKLEKILNKGKHYVKVDFQGIGLAQEPFWFPLYNPGKEGNLSIGGQIKKPNLRKEGFQTE